MHMTTPRKTILAAAILALVGTGTVWTACSRSTQHATKAAATTRYQCPMHPTYVAEKPGAGPICATALVPMPQGPAATPASAGPRKLAHYRSPMDPAIRSSVPAKDSMGMDFIPVYEDELGASSTVPGRAAVLLSP